MAQNYIEQFKENCNNPVSCHGRFDGMGALDRNEPEWIISGAFDWSTSTQGFMEWSRRASVFINQYDMTAVLTR